MSLIDNEEDKVGIRLLLCDIGIQALFTATVRISLKTRSLFLLLFKTNPISISYIDLYPVMFPMIQSL